MSKDCSAGKITSFPSTLISFFETLGLCTAFFKETAPPFIFSMKIQVNVPYFLIYPFVRYGKINPPNLPEGWP